MSVKGRAHKRDYRAELERLDELSKLRALTDAESMLLQRCIDNVDGQRASYGHNKEMARLGIGRNDAQQDKPSAISFGDIAVGGA